MIVKNPSWKKYFADKKVNICVVGGGNIGSLLLGDFGSKGESVSARLYTPKPSKWSNKIEVCNKDGEVKYVSNLDLVSNNPSDVIADADIIISTLPSHVFPKVLKDIEPFIKTGAMIGVMPGSGGGEFFCKDLVKKGCIFFGFQRVHGIARMKEQGKSVLDLGRKKELFISAMPSEKTEDVCAIMEELLKVKCNRVPNYLSVTLTPSNPILHTTRVYTMFYDYKGGMYWDRMIKFYEEWTDEASQMLIYCDAELQMICNKITGLDLTGVKSLKENYNAGTVDMMTKNISTNEPYQGINSPMLETMKGFIPDLNSRYFWEDYPYGLCIIKGFADIVGVEVPNIDKVLMWFEKLVGVNYYVDGKFEGKDLEGLPIPKNYGLKNVEDIVKFYE